MSDCSIDVTHTHTCAGVFTRLNKNNLKFTVLLCSILS